MSLVTHSCHASSSASSHQSCTQRRKLRLIAWLTAWWMTLTTSTEMGLKCLHFHAWVHACMHACMSMRKGIFARMSCQVERVCLLLRYPFRMVKVAGCILSFVAQKAIGLFCAPCLQNINNTCAVGCEGSCTSSTRALQAAASATTAAAM